MLESAEPEYFVPHVDLTKVAVQHLGTAVLDELGVGAAHVLGVSFGGAVAQQMAFSHPSRVRRKVPMKIDCDCGNDTFQVSVNGHIHGTECHKTEGSDFRTESHLTAWYFDEGLSNG